MTGGDTRARAGRLVGYAIGALLLVAAIGVVWQRRDALSAAFAAARHPAPALVGGLAFAVALNVVLSAAFLRSLLLRYGRVGWLEMNAVVAGATLLNYLPLRPGLFGRVAYHKRVNGIAARDTALTVVQGAVISAALAAALGGVAAHARWSGWSLWPGVGVVGAACAGSAALPQLRRWAAPLVIRFVEVIVWAVRYDLSFRIIGAPLTAEAALALACASVIATMVPFVSNGLGLREWAIGLLAPVLTTHTLELGVTAELVNRAVELVVIGGLGIPALPWLARRGDLRRESVRP